MSEHEAPNSMRVQRFRASLTTGYWPDNPEPLIRDPSGDYVKYAELAFSEQEIVDREKLIAKLADGLREIYTLRGEDEVIADICNPLIQSSRLYVDGT